VAALGESVRSAGAVFQAHIYAGSGHLFTDPDLPEYDPASAGALQDRMLAFIEQL
jgi:dienelactone hydrolase